MTNNYDNALTRAEELVGEGRRIQDVIKEVTDDFLLTEYEQSELREELYLFHEDYL